MGHLLQLMLDVKRTNLNLRYFHERGGNGTIKKPLEGDGGRRGGLGRKRRN